MKMERFAPDFRACLLASCALHAAFFLFRFMKLPSFAPAGPVEIDLTMPFVGNGPAKLAAPKALVPHAKLPPAPVEQPLPPQPVKPPPPKDWVMPGKDTKIVKPPTPEAPPPTQGGVKDGSGISPLPGGSGPGFAYGVPNGSLTPGAPANVIRPQLLNLDEVVANMRKFYPERERYLNHEGKVIVDIHLDAEGGIVGVDIVQSAGRLFDDAAIKVAKLMKYSPARTPSGPISAKIRKTMEFKLQD